MEEGRDGGESDRIDICIVPGNQPVPDAVCGVQSTFSVIAEAHLGLAEADCIFPLADAIELLELGLIDALHIELVHALHATGVVVHGWKSCQDEPDLGSRFQGL